jgi:hypothetical protein
MEQITLDSIAKAIEKIDNLTDDAIEKLMETLSLSQNNLIGYVMQAGAEYKNEELNSYSMYYMTILHEAYVQQGFAVAPISEDNIEEFQEPFILALDLIHKDEDYVPLNELIDQPHLMTFMANEIDQKDADGNMLDDATATQLFIVSSAMVGLMSKNAS